MRLRLPEVAHRDLNAPLPADAEDQAIQGARRDAIFAGMSAALLSGQCTYPHSWLLLYIYVFSAAVIGSRFMGFGRTQMILSGVGSGLLSGYYFNQAFLAANMSELDKEKARLDSMGVNSESTTTTTGST
ncbi:hypothetical protein FB45DRAFT_1036456 [Roridomyces roridus]|uniref:Uncharacterized protein n=1 Tax=Roridomyces roridus TaxID=1738132 RepID=A0AAD7B964_9AGAR|nr:hypothetical protein FB45DRAFT_1036456 [Roridomyces roridus]